MTPIFYLRRVDSERTAETNDSYQAELDRMTGYIRDGVRYAVLTAHPRSLQGAFPDDMFKNPDQSPYAQYSWREECTPVGVSGPGLQIEIASDAFLGWRYSSEVKDTLIGSGFAPPFEFGADYCNWTLFRVGEGTEPRSVAGHVVTSLLLLVYRTLRGLDVPLDSWKFESEWIVAEERFDLHSRLMR